MQNLKKFLKQSLKFLTKCVLQCKNLIQVHTVITYLNNSVFWDTFSHRFLTAKLYDYEEEMVRVYLENDDAWGERAIDFDDVMLVAKLLVKDGKDSLAWEVISKKLKTWQPYEFHEVEPIALLNDDVLFGVLTPQRCEVVLSTKYENKLKDLP